MEMMHKLGWGIVLQGLMRIVGIIVVDPALKSSANWKGKCHSFGQTRSSFMVLKTRSVSALPLGLFQVVKICLMPKIAQSFINVVEVGWHPLSVISDGFFEAK